MMNLMVSQIKNTIWLAFFKNITIIYELSQGSMKFIDYGIIEKTFYFYGYLFSFFFYGYNLFRTKVYIKIRFSVTNKKRIMG